MDIDLGNCTKGSPGSQLAVPPGRFPQTIVSPFAVPWLSDTTVFNLTACMRVCCNVPAYWFTEDLSRYVERKVVKRGMAMTATVTMIATTINSSSSEKPLRVFIRSPTISSRKAYLDWYGLVFISITQLRQGYFRVRHLSKMLIAKI